MIIYSAAIPILDSLVSTIVQGLEVVKGLLCLKVAELQKKVDATSSEEEQTQTRVIGFALPDDDEEEYEEEYEDE